MKNPTRILVLFVLIASAAMLLSGCIRKISDENATETDMAELDEDEGIEDITAIVISDEPLTEDGSLLAEEPEAGEAGSAAQPAQQVSPPVTAPTSTAVQQVVVREGQLVTMKPRSYDPDGDIVQYTFSAPLDSEGKWQTKAGDKGKYVVQITASDSKSTTTKTVEIIVKEVNIAPVLDEMSDIEVKTGDTVMISPKATDANNDPLAFTYSGWMATEARVTTESDAGNHPVTITVSDGELTGTQTINVKVMPRNNAPVMEKISDIMVDEGDAVSFDPKVSDPDGDKVVITYSGWMTSSAYTTDFDDSGEYTVKVTASDGSIQTSQSVKVIVKDYNRPVQMQLDFEIS